MNPRALTAPLARMAPHPQREAPEDPCPITHADMNVLPAHALIDAADGRRYTKEGLRGWLQVSSQSPIDPRCSLLPDVPRLWPQRPSAYERACGALVASRATQRLLGGMRVVLTGGVLAEAAMVGSAWTLRSRALAELLAHRHWYAAQMQDVQAQMLEALEDVQHLFVDTDPQRWRHLPRAQLHADALAYVEQEMRHQRHELRRMLHHRLLGAEARLEGAERLRAQAELPMWGLLCLMGLFVGTLGVLHLASRTATEVASRRLLTPAEQALVLRPVTAREQAARRAQVAADAER